MATLTSLRKQENLPESTLLLAFELGLKTWKLGFARGLSDKPWLREIARGDQEALLKEIAAAKQHFKLSPTTPVQSC